MLIYEFLEMQGDEYIYCYYPDGDKSMPGRVGIKADGSKRIIEESKNDFGKHYAHHAMKGIDITKEKGTIAWY